MYFGHFYPCLTEFPVFFQFLGFCHGIAELFVFGFLLFFLAIGFLLLHCRLLFGIFKLFHIAFHVHHKTRSGLNGRCDILKKTTVEFFGCSPQV
ncbi:hypothetical protein D3C86_1601640 [compost metagenome]